MNYLKMIILMNFKDERMKEIMRINYLLVITISRVSVEQDFISGTILWAKGQSNSPCKSFMNEVLSFCSKFELYEVISYAYHGVGGGCHRGKTPSIFIHEYRIEG